MTKLPLNSLYFCLFLVAVLFTCPASAQSPQECGALAGLVDTELNMEIATAEWRTDFIEQRGPYGQPSDDIMPAHCHIEGIMDARTTSDGKHLAIGIALNLPADWNGRFLFQGGAGLNGRAWDPVGLRASARNPALARGFAVASTDSGHQGSSPFDASFVDDQEALINFYYRANARVTVAAKKLVRNYYGSSSKYSYFVGCSTGGREGMIMSQRYPYYYDGIVAGAPAMRTGDSNLALKWISVQLNQVAKIDEAGKAVPGTAFTEQQREAIMDKLLNTCDANDGIADGMIFDTQGCAFDPADMVCNSETDDSCLNQAQAKALKKAFAGPVDSSGRQVYPGFLYDTGINTTAGIPGLLRGGTSPVDPTSATATGMDVDAEAALADNQVSSLGDSLWTNLSSFSGNGGKLIFYHGVSDAWFSASETIRYYKEMSTANGGMDQVRNWSRVYLAPGMLHCDGGQSLDSFDMIKAIVDWVEKDIVPDRVIATGNVWPGRSRPLCAFPEFAYYTGAGDPEDAASFECRE